MSEPIREAARELELVLPAYNEADSLPSLIERVAVTAKQAGHSTESFRLVLVDNGSTDHTRAVLKTLKSGPRGCWFNVVHVEKNMGYGHGLFMGLQATKAPYLAWSHADMQCDPKDVFAAYKILRKLEGDRHTHIHSAHIHNTSFQNAPNQDLAASGHRSLHIVKGVRHGRNKRDIFVSRIFEFFAFCLLGVKLHEINAQPKVFPRTLLAHLRNPPRTFAFDLYFLYHAVKAGYAFETISVRFPPRIHGVSKWASNFLSRYRTIWGMICYMNRLRKEEGRV